MGIGRCLRFGHCLRLARRLKSPQISKAEQGAEWECAFRTFDLLL